MVVVLDEPDAHLDAEGAAALNRAVAALKGRGGAAVIAAHRSSAFTECDVVLAMEAGALRPVKPAPGVAGAPRPGETVPVTRVAGPPGAGRGQGGPLQLVQAAPPSDRDPDAGSDENA